MLPTPAESPQRPVAPVPTRLWNRNFLLLWQGQIVSSLGDVTHSIALGFWILAVTGSTALMGSLMAASTVPRILVAPFAGVLVDRIDRRRLLIWMDTIRGIACAMAMSITMVLFPLSPAYFQMPALMFVAGCSNVMRNTFIMVAMQLAVPGEMRGKAFSFVAMLLLFGPLSMRRSFRELVRGEARV
jgi:MFS family permease